MPRNRVRLIIEEMKKVRSAAPEIMYSHLSMIIASLETLRDEIDNAR